ncbi:type I glyceraldehyde-3-phosphate dehydrogenase [Candidatus Dojkabacteria bacterium]|uniref:Glyceraldehyde-3-phosphate dehydrogenase n=1 Tax=Candidatus Dojkabacteria bacterium TaxID=2099670 RepID=A0A3M0Z2D8_9BACT|nr:MAG: type I glyceraldehyde-3-phosphate dehydrogenase [Candidatus Dojkabacteria bacterium]
MTRKLAINGFGRIGRLVFRALLEKGFLDQKIELVAVNDVVPADNLAYLLKFDTVHGRIKHTINTISNDTIEVVSENGLKSSFKTLNLKVKPSELPWSQLGVDIVVESTGLFTKKVDAEGHLIAGAKKVIISAPSDEDVKTIIMGVNHDEYNGETLVSNASCTTNCLAAIVHVLLKEGIGIDEGLMTTAHAYTASQPIVDGPSKKDFRDGRAGAVNIIPASTGAAKAIGLVIPKMKGRLTGMALRVPVSDVSVVDLTFRSSKETSLAEINVAMKKASDTYLKGILNYTEEPVVSSDFIHDPASCTYDATASIELNSRFFKLIAWYDNEWGYSNRIVDLINLILEKSKAN